MRFRSAAASKPIALLAALFLLLVWLPGALADNDGQASDFKPMAPHIDPNAQSVHKPKALQGSVQRSEDLGKKKKKAAKSFNANAASGGGFMDKLRGNRPAEGEATHGKANNNTLSTQATSGVGIIGVRFILAAGRPPIINRVFAGTPAADVGLQPEDAIVAVDGVPTYGLTKEEVYDLIIGSPGTSVNVSVQRGGDFRVVTCTRMDINDITDPIVRRDYMLSM